MSIIDYSNNPPPVSVEKLLKVNYYIRPFRTRDFCMNVMNATFEHENDAVIWALENMPVDLQFTIEKVYKRLS
jgi:hypothetical protein